jgi:uncharacterized protein (DUF697 family)
MSFSDDDFETTVAEETVDPLQISPSWSRLENRIGDLILDYAIGVSILALIPIPRFFTAKILVAAGLNLKMMGDIGRLCQFWGGQGPLAIAGNLFGGIGAFAMALMAWLTVLGIGIYVPYIKGLALAAAFFTLTWNIGQATKQFYASSYGDGRKRRP